MINTSTSPANPTCCNAPNVPSACAVAPPPQAVMPTLIRLMPMSVTTMPDTNGVIIRRVYFSRRLMNISTEDATIQAPKIADNPPVSPADMIGPINEKLVPWMQSRPHPINPTRRHCI